MATLDDKLLGEKLQNYCSSSSEDEEDQERNDDERKSKKTSKVKFIPESQLKENETSNNYKKSAINTGPKGVINDWQRFKQLENEKREEAEKEKKELVKRLAMTCRCDDLDKEVQKEKKTTNNEVNMDELEKDLLEDEFFQEYLRKKIEEMNRRILELPKFGNIIELTNDMFLNEIDKENKQVTIIIHIYDQKIPECRLLNECLEVIAKEYATVKFCKIKSVEINLSDKFRKHGCPALLIYKNGELIGNFVKMNDEFGDEFCSSDIENFLLEHGFLPSQEIKTIRSGLQSNNNQDSNNKNESDEDDD